jgi:hypothetical protein
MIREWLEKDEIRTGEILNSQNGLTEK